ncbi:MAG TPA: response regulator, partial [Methylomirabilota bacterium]|nr:response regulator [Methylomirabilota bacterium]
SAELPAVTPAAAAAPPERPESASGRGGGEHILYLDDEEPLVFLAIRTLERLGYRVTGCTRAEEAIATFRARPQDFDLVVTDFNMPGMSGLDVARQILSIRPDAAVVMTSGYLRTGEVEAARAVGIREVILKPGTVEEMGPLVRQILQKRPRGSGAATPDTASF